MPRGARVLVGLAVLLVAACGPAPPEVVVYTSVDPVYAAPVLSRFEAETGIRVRAVYDTEAAKSAGLAQRLMLERGRPVADVFWSSEQMQVLRLARAGVLAPYESPAAAGIPARFRDPARRWTGFGLRFRLFVCQDGRCPEAPTMDHLARRMRPACVLANPRFGTTATHLAALLLTEGEAALRDRLAAWRRAGLRLVPGNAHAVREVASGRASCTIADVDDVKAAERRGQRVAGRHHDQDGRGTFAVFHTVAVVAGAPHPREARALVDHLVSPAVERTLVALGAVSASVRERPDPGGIRWWTTARPGLAQAYERLLGILADFGI